MCAAGSWVSNNAVLVVFYVHGHVTVLFAYDTLASADLFTPFLIALRSCIEVALVLNQVPWIHFVPERKQTYKINSPKTEYQQDWGSHDGEVVFVCLLGCNTAWASALKLETMFLWNVVFCLQIHTALTQETSISQNMNKINYVPRKWEVLPNKQHVEKYYQGSLMQDSVLWNCLTVTPVVWRFFDSVGFNNFEKQYKLQVTFRSLILKEEVFRVFFFSL